MRGSTARNSLWAIGRPMYAISFIAVSCFGAFILSNLWRRPYPRPSKSLNVWFGPLPTHGENQIRYFLRDALYALAWTVGLFLPVLLLVIWGVQFGRSSASPIYLQAILVTLVLLGYLMAFNFTTRLLLAFILSLFRSRRIFNETLGRFVTERSYR